MTTHKTPATSNGRTRAALIAAAMVMVLAACGSRRDHPIAAAGLGQPGAPSAEDGSADVEGLQPDTTVTSAGQTGSGGPAGGSSTGGGEAPDQSSSRTPGSPVRIGLVGTLSGQVGATFVPIRDGVQTWVSAVNARGGVNGHQVELIVADDQASAAVHRSKVQQLVEERGVVAFVGNPDSLTGAGSLDYINEHKVPLVGGDLGAPYAYDSPFYFPQASSGLALVQAAVASIATQTVDTGQTKVGFVSCTEVQVCRDAARVAEQLAEHYGAELVYSGKVSLFAPDFTAECINARDAGAQVMGVVMDGYGVTRVAQSCARQGFRPDFAFTSTVILPEHRENPALQGAFIPVNIAPWFDDSAAVQEFRSAIATYAPGVDPSAGSIIGWTAGKLFELAAANLPEPPTSAGVLEGLYAIHGDDLGGLTHPLSFRRGQPAEPMVCWFNVRIADNDFVSPDGGERHCDEFLL